jgi:hypothetical protein
VADPEKPPALLVPEVVAVAAEVEAPQLVGCLAEQVALGEEHFLSAVELDVLTTFVAERSRSSFRVVSVLSTGVLQGRGSDRTAFLGPPE